MSMLILVDGVGPHTYDDDFISADLVDLQRSWCNGYFIASGHLFYRKVFDIEHIAIAQKIPYAVIAP